MFYIRIVVWRAFVFVFFRSACVLAVWKIKCSTFLMRFFVRGCFAQVVPNGFSANLDHGLGHRTCKAGARWFCIWHVWNGTGCIAETIAGFFFVMVCCKRCWEGGQVTVGKDKFEGWFPWRWCTFWSVNFVWSRCIPWRCTSSKIEDSIFVNSGGGN